MDEEDYYDALDAWSSFSDYAQKCIDEGVDPWTGKLLTLK